MNIILKIFPCAFVAAIASIAAGQTVSSVLTYTYTAPENVNLCIKTLDMESAAAGAMVCGGTECPSAIGIAIDVDSWIGAAIDDNCLGRHTTQADALVICGPFCDSFYSSFASVSGGDSSITVILASVYTLPDCAQDCSNQITGEPDIGASAGLAYSHVIMSITHEPEQQGAPLTRSEGTLTIQGTVFVPASPSDASDGRVLTLIPFLGCTTTPTLVQAELGHLGNGIDSAGAVNTTVSCGSGTFVLQATDSFSVSDVRLDADGNGRFNERDWHLIALTLGSTLQADLDKYNLYTEPDLNSNNDFIDDQIIAQEDLDIIRNMLDAGLGAGEFGDWDGDGVVDCGDHSTAPTTFNATIGDANYRVEVDYDLDGDNDATDRSAFDALYPTADIAAPFGVLDLADLTAFATAHANQDPIADLSPDYGIWDLADLTAFVTAFNTPCP